MKKVAVLQSNYLPWKGYFDLIHDVDLFVFYDDVQFTKNDWRNRNRIKTAQGTQWLTVPVGASLDRLICEVRLEDSRWQARHWKTILQSYSRAPHFSMYRDFFEDFFMRRRWASLSEMNQYLIKAIAAQFLGVRTEFRDSREFAVSGAKLDRLLSLLSKVGATHYFSGPAAKAYIDESRFSDAGIRLTYKDYSAYPAYPQLYPPFEHPVSVIDLLFSCGARSAELIWGPNSKPCDPA